MLAFVISVGVVEQAVMPIIVTNAAAVARKGNFFIEILVVLVLISHP